MSTASINGIPELLRANRFQLPVHGHHPTTSRAWGQKQKPPFLRGLRLTQDATRDGWRGGVRRSPGRRNSNCSRGLLFSRHPPPPVIAPCCARGRALSADSSRRSSAFGLASASWTAVAPYRFLQARGAFQPGLVEGNFPDARTKSARGLAHSMTSRRLHGAPHSLLPSSGRSATIMSFRFAETSLPLPECLVRQPQRVLRVPQRGVGMP